MFTSIHKDQTERKMTLVDKHFLIYQKAEQCGVNVLQHSFDLSLHLSDITQETNNSAEPNFGEKLIVCVKQNLQVQ